MITQGTLDELNRQIELNRNLCRFCSYLISHLANHEDIERYDNMFMDIIQGKWNIGDENETI